MDERSVSVSLLAAGMGSLSSGERALDGLSKAFPPQQPRPQHFCA
jgi:hypothetical protein